jgi:polyketide cyclase/dehydrase/lipid transport protein
LTERAAQRRVAIGASPDACFAALVDYESMPEWQRAVAAALWSSAKRRGGAGRVVDWEIDARLRSISYRLRYAYEEPHSIECRLVEGDIEDVRASYEIAADGRERTVVSLALHVRPGVPVPGALERILARVLLRGTLDDLRRRVEVG